MPKHTTVRQCHRNRTFRCTDLRNKILEENIQNLWIICILVTCHDSVTTITWFLSMSTIGLVEFYPGSTRQPVNIQPGAFKNAARWSSHEPPIIPLCHGLDLMWSKFVPKKSSHFFTKQISKSIRIHMGKIHVKTNVPTIQFSLKYTIRIHRFAFLPRDNLRLASSRLFTTPWTSSHLKAAFKVPGRYGYNWQTSQNQGKVRIEENWWLVNIPLNSLVTSGEK